MQIGTLKFGDNNTRRTIYMKQYLKKAFRIMAISILICFSLIPLSVSAADNENSNGSYSAENPHMIINQIYGSSASSEYISHDFIELYNPTDESVDLSGWSVQYRASAADKASSDLSWNKLTLSGVVPPRHSYLVRCRESSKYSGTDIISDYDISWDIALYNKGLSVVLMSTDTLIPSDSAVFDNDTKYPVVEGYVDMLSVAGNDEKPEQIPETYETAVNAWQSKKTGIIRNSFADTDDNSTDVLKADYSTENVSAIFPKSTNSGEWGAPAEIDKSMSFSADSGFYDSAFDLKIEHGDGKLYYTLDGSEPDPDSENTYEYDDAKGIVIGDATENANTISMRTDISAGYYLNDEGMTLGGYVSPEYQIDKCTVVRAAAYYEDGTRSDTYTNSYFVDFDNRDSIKNLNVLSLVATPEDLFDYEKGIYVLGKNEAFDSNHWWWSNGNFRLKGKNWERKASMEFFGTDGKLIADQIGGIRIHGGGSRGFAQKSFNLYAREEFDGNKRFNYDFFGTGYRAKKLTLSNGGDDIKSKSADYMINTSCSGDEYYGIAKMIPYALFLNGEYWGMYYLTEKYDDKYIEYYYGVKDSNVAIIKNGEVEEGVDEDLSTFNQMKSFIVESDMGDEENYKKACELIDIDSFIHYYGTEIYIGRNMDWPISNWATWRARETGDGTYEDGRWRWLIFDLNSGSMGDGSNKNPKSVRDTAITDGMFKSLMENKEFREKMLTALEEIGTKYLSEDSMDAFLNNYIKNYLTPLEASHDRYFGKDADSGIESLISDRKTFFDNRYDWIVADMKEYATGHIWNNDYTVDIAATCTQDGKESIHCSICNEVKENSARTIKATGHTFGSWTTTKATTEINAGEQTRTCLVCGFTETQAIPKITPSDTPSTTDVTPPSPEPIVDPTNSAAPATSAEIADLPKVKITKPKAAKKSATIKWKKVSKKNQKKIAKIQIQYSLDKMFKTGLKTVTAKKTATSKVIKKLKSKKTYYVRIRAYTKSGGKVHISKWSKIKSVKIR